MVLLFRGSGQQRQQNQRTAASGTVVFVRVLLRRGGLGLITCIAALLQTWTILRRTSTLMSAQPRKHVNHHEFVESFLIKTMKNTKAADSAIASGVADAASLPQEKGGSSSSSNYLIANSKAAEGGGEGGSKPNGNGKKGSLLERAPLLQLMRQNVSIRSVYDFPRQQQWQHLSVDDPKCSCRNPLSTFECCARTIRRSHKFGCVMTAKLFQQYDTTTAGAVTALWQQQQQQQPLYKLAAEPYEHTYTDVGPPKNQDYRDVLVLRNIYSALISGFLFHRSGRECDNPRKLNAYLGTWHEHLSYNLGKQQLEGKTMCKFLFSNRKNVAMRAYMDWVIRYYYSPLFSHWALAQEMPEMKERTLVVCYEDLLSKERDLETVHRMVDFVFDGRPPTPWNGTAPGHANRTDTWKTRKHTTDNKSEERKAQLLNTIKFLDERFYNGEIAWLDSILPC